MNVIDLTLNLFLMSWPVMTIIEMIRIGGWIKWISARTFVILFNAIR